MQNGVLRTQNVSKRYGSVLAVSKIDFSIDKGEIRAIVGGNGAGKSTFVKILFGGIVPDDGVIYLNGEPVRFKSPADALARGISLVPQDFGLIESMSVAENISLTDRVTNSTVYRASIANQRADKLFQRLSIAIDPTKKVDDLSVAEKQLVAIAKALSKDSEILIFDEPTSVLDANSFALIKNILSDLKKLGKSIIYVTHKLNEVFDVADSVSVFAGSKIVFTSDVLNLKKEDLLSHFNIAASSEVIKNFENNAPPLLVVKNLATQNIDNISFTVNAGESIGVVSDRHLESVELIKAIFGVVRRRSGAVTINNNILTSPSSCISNNVGFIPDDRWSEGLFRSFDIFENISILSFKNSTRFGVFRKSFLVQCAKEKIEKLRIKCESTYQSIADLSGGNQQKVMLARWMSRDLDLLLLLEPTAGIDVGGKSDIHSIILGLKYGGTSFLISSSDTRELEFICDKILLLASGKFVKFMPAPEYFSQR